MQQIVKTTNNFFIADKHLLANYTNKNNTGTVKCEHLFCSFIMVDEEATSKTRSLCFIMVSKHSKTIKALRSLRSPALISFGNSSERLALVFSFFVCLFFNSDF